MIRFFLMLICLLLLTSTAEACPTCKLALEGGSDHSQQGYAYSILFMMAMPFAIALAWAVFIIRSMRRQRISQDEFMAEIVADSQ